MSHKGLSGSRLLSRKSIHDGPKNSSCDGLQMADSHSEEIVRQQWNFSPPETVRELQEYHVELSDVTVLELIITPDISGGMARASVKSLRVS
jgi:hypothetical protein